MLSVQIALGIFIAWFSIKVIESIIKRRKVFERNLIRFFEITKYFLIKLKNGFSSFSKTELQTIGLAFFLLMLSVITLTAF